MTAFPDGLGQVTFSPVPGGPRKSASSRRAMNVAVAQVKDHAPIHLLVEVEIEGCRGSTLRIAKLCLFAAPFPTVGRPRRVSFHRTPDRRGRSMGAIGSACACCRRVSSTAAIAAETQLP